MAKERIEVICPSCHTKMTVDANTGLVIHSERQKSVYSFDEAIEKERARKDKSDELFAKAFENEKKRQDSLEDKFREAMESKDDLDEPPPRPWDLD
jgi:hypothetical protein